MSAQYRPVVITIDSGSVSGAISLSGHGAVQAIMDITALARGVQAMFCDGFTSVELRDALLRELVGKWSADELAQVLPVVATLTESRSEAEGLRAELSALKQGVEVPNMYGLLPCPCCGSEPVGETGSDGGKYVECTDPQCRLSTPIFFPVMEDVGPRLIEIWNRRANARPVPAPPPLPADKVVVDKSLLAILEESADTLADHVHARNIFGWGHRARICVNCLDALRAQPTTNEKGE